MSHETLVKALLDLGYDSGWVITDGVVSLWENPKPRPTDAELKAAGWVPSCPEVEA